MCSYCGCRDIELIGRLSNEHDQIVNATTALRVAAAEQDVPGVAQACGTLARLLDPHVRLEERGLFAELRQQEEFTAHVDALCGEHRDIDGELDAIAAGDLARVTGFIRLLRDHISKEENGLFPAAAIALDGEQWERLNADRPDAETPLTAGHTAH